MKFTILKKCWICLFIFCLILLGGCNTVKRYEDTSVIKEDLSRQAADIELYVLDEIKSGKYEPDTGIYTGAYVQKDENIAGDIAKYEALIGQEQTFKVFNYKASEGITKQDILKCIAQKKIPYIKIILSTDYDLTTLYQLIFDLKDSYRTPVFIELYPLTEKSYSPIKYRETYQRAYEILHKYLEDIVVVWSSDDTRMEDISLYYPGDPYADWVGINIYIPRYKQDMPYNYTTLHHLDYWYKTFQSKKPMLISGLAISHFSKVDHSYTVQDTISKLTLFYQDALEQYPRIKGIIYMDVNMANISQNGKEDYEITRHHQIVEAMKALSLPLNIRQRLMETDKEQTCYQKYSVDAIYYENQLYIPQEYMSVCFNKVPLRKIRHIEDLSGKVYYAYDDIKSYCTTFYME